MYRSPSRGKFATEHYDLDFDKALDECSVSDYADDADEDSASQTSERWIKERKRNRFQRRIRGKILDECAVDDDLNKIRTRKKSLSLELNPEANEFEKSTSLGATKLNPEAKDFTPSDPSDPEAKDFTPSDPEAKEITPSTNK